MSSLLRSCFILLLIFVTTAKLDAQQLSRFAGKVVLGRLESETTLMSSRVMVAPDGTIYFYSNAGFFYDNFGFIGKIDAATKIVSKVADAKGGMVVLGADGNFYVADNNGLYKITPAGVTTLIAGADH